MVRGYVGNSFNVCSIKVQNIWSTGPRANLRVVGSPHAQEQRTLERNVTYFVLHTYSLYNCTEVFIMNTFMIIS